MIRCTLAIIVASLLAAMPAAWALDAALDLRQLHHATWAHRDGAPGEVFVMAETTDGYLWLGTSNGLVRFDGSRFEPLNALTDARLPSLDIYSLLALPDGALLIGMGAHGLAQLKDGQLSTWSEADGFPGGAVASLARQSDGSLWAASSRGLMRNDGSGWATVPGHDGGAQAVFVDRSDRVWVATRDRILFQDSRTRGFQATDIRVGTVAQFAQSPDDAIWIAETTRSVRPIWVPGPETEPPPTEIRVGANGLLFDRDGTLWIATLGDGLRRSRDPAALRGLRIAQVDPRIDSASEAGGLASDFIYSVLEDHEGNVWLGSSRGLDRFRRGSLVTLPLPSAYHALLMVPRGGSTLWLGSASRAMVAIDPRRGIQPLEIEAGGSSAAFRDADGSLWWNAGAVLHHRRAGRFEQLELPAAAAGSRLNWITRDGRGRLVIGVAGSGLFWRDGSHWQPLGRDAGLPDETAKIEFTDERGRLWLGYPGNRVVVFDDGEVRRFGGEDGIAVGDVRVIAGARTRLWVGGTAGVALRRGEGFVRLELLGPGPSNVAGLVESDDGALWIACEQGIARIAPEALAAFEADAAGPVPARWFDSLDGLAGSIQQLSIHPAAVRADDGRLWFATLAGLAWIDPKQIEAPPPAPAAEIRALQIAGQSRRPASGLRLPAGTRDLGIDYAAASLGIPERLRFRFRLQGIDRDWQEVGARRSAYYANLGPGDYRFEVSAANGEGPWHAQPTALVFSIDPTFTQSRGFLVLIGLLAVATIALLYRLRLGQITQRLQQLHEERLTERERIARELHDTLLQGVQGLILRFQGAVLGLSPQDPVRQSLLDTLERANQTLAEGRDQVLGLREGGYAERLPDAIIELARGLAHEDRTETPADFSLRIEGTARPLKAPAAEELFQIASEALRNAFRHAASTRIEVCLRYRSQDFALRIQDDGRGLPEAVLKHGREGHWGLTGMRERALRLGARWQLDSAPGTGTVIEVVLPAAQSYPGERSTFLWRLWTRRRRPPDDRAP